MSSPISETILITYEEATTMAAAMGATVTPEHLWLAEQLVAMRAGLPLAIEDPSVSQE